METKTNTTCSRCSGNGLIPCFSHVMGGVCFRCWGSGRDPQELHELEAWLVRARDEYRALRAAGKEGSAFGRQLVAQGKANAAKVAEMSADRAAYQSAARAMYRPVGV
jgi:hypothetical protein